MRVRNRSRCTPRPRRIRRRAPSRRPSTCRRPSSTGRRARSRGGSCTSAKATRRRSGSRRPSRRSRADRRRWLSASGLAATSASLQALAAGRARALSRRRLLRHPRDGDASSSRAGEWRRRPSTWRTRRRAPRAPAEYEAHLGRVAVQPADEDRGPRGAGRDRARGGRASVGRRHVRVARAAASARARRRRRRPLDDEVSRRPQRRAGRRARRSAKRASCTRERCTSATSWAPWRRPFNSLAGAAGHPDARLPHGARTARTPWPSPARSPRPGTSRRCTTRASSRIPATPWRSGR